MATDTNLDVESHVVEEASRKLRDACPKCGHGNVIRSKYCNECGASLESIKRPPVTDDATRQSEHRDIAHPITLECREYIQKSVLEFYEKEQ